MDEQLKENLMGALEQVIDPELGIDIVNIGLVYDVELDDDGLCTVSMTLTTMGCPLAGILTEQVQMALSDIPEVKDTNVNLVWNPLGLKIVCHAMQKQRLEYVKLNKNEQVGRVLRCTCYFYTKEQRIRTMNYEMISDYKDNKMYRDSFNRLAESTFDINFEEWYRDGFWNDKYVCYSYIDDNKVIANVSINKMNLIYQGKITALCKLGQ